MVVDEISLQFGKNSLLVDRILFFNSCQNNASSIGSSSSSMDFAELKLMLEVFDILPKYVSISQVNISVCGACGVLCLCMNVSTRAHIHAHVITIDTFCGYTFSCLNTFFSTGGSSIQIRQLGKK